MVTIEPRWTFAPAKVNLTLHVTDRRPDGYHILDSYVMFADAGDKVRVAWAEQTSLSVSGPFAQDVPTDRTNLCWRAAEAFGQPVAIELEKNLPPASGIGGGSSDAAAVIRALEGMTGRPCPFDPIRLGADVPVCVAGRATHVQGIGETALPLNPAPIHAVLVNPGVSVSTRDVFQLLRSSRNAPMTPLPKGNDLCATLGWLTAQRNDLQAAALTLVPEIAGVLEYLEATHGCALARISGSGATCFGLYRTRQEADKAATRLASARSAWWVKACSLR